MSQWKRSRATLIAGSSTTTPNARIKAIATWANVPSIPSTLAWQLLRKKLSSTPFLLSVYDMAFFSNRDPSSVPVASITSSLRQSWNEQRFVARPKAFYEF